MSVVLDLERLRPETITWSIPLIPLAINNWEGRPKIGSNKQLSGAQTADSSQDRSVTSIGHMML